MSKRAAAVLGLVIAVVGFGLGRYAASPRDAGEAEPGTARPGESADALVDESADALADVLRDPDAFSRARRLATLLPALGPEAIPEVRAALEDPWIQFKRSGSEIELLVRFWATHQPAQASVWALTEAPAGCRDSVSAVAIELWAREDPEAAYQRAGSRALGSALHNRMLEIALLRGWVESGQTGFEKRIRDLGQSFQQQRALGSLARIMIRRDGPEAVMRWAESLPDEPASFKLAAFRQVGTVLTEVDLDAARRWCDAHCDEPFGRNMRKRIATRWVLQDGPGAMEWLSSEPAGAETDFAVRSAFRTWLWKDRKAAWRWMAAKGPEGLEPWLKPAIRLYAQGLARDDPPEAAKWAPLIPNDKEREIIMIALARSWRERDEAEAEAWLRESPLSEEAREKARQPQPQKGARSQRQAPFPPATPLSPETPLFEATPPLEMW